MFYFNIHYIDTIDLLPVCDQTVRVESEKQDRIHQVT